MFDAKAVVPDGTKQRERNAKVLLDQGAMTITSDRNEVLHSIPYRAVMSVSYSKARQPLWNSPGGPAPIVRVEGGALGFLKGDRHWVALRTKDAFVVVRVDADQVARVLSAIEARTGRTTDRIVERQQ